MKNLANKIDKAKTAYEKSSKNLNDFLSTRIIQNMKVLDITEYFIKGICGVTEDIIYAGDCNDSITKINVSGIAYSTYNGNRESEEIFGLISKIPTDSLIRLDQMIQKEISKKS